jgi:hypothetical protein
MVKSVEKKRVPGQSTSSIKYSLSLTKLLFKNNKHYDGGTGLAY